MIITLAAIGLAIFSTYMVVKYKGLKGAIAQLKLDVAAAKSEAYKIEGEAKTKVALAKAEMARLINGAKAEEKDMAAAAHAIISKL